MVPRFEGARARGTDQTASKSNLCAASPAKVALVRQARTEMPHSGPHAVCTGFERPGRKNRTVYRPEESCRPASRTSMNRPSMLCSIQTGLTDDGSYFQESSSRRTEDWKKSCIAFAKGLNLAAPWGNRVARLGGGRPQAARP